MSNGVKAAAALLVGQASAVFAAWHASHGRAWWALALALPAGANLFGAAVLAGQRGVTDVPPTRTASPRGRGPRGL